MALHDDSFTGNYFAVEIDGLTLGYFTGCSGLSIELSVMEYKQVLKTGRPGLAKYAGRPKYSEVVLKRGFTANKDLLDWYKEVSDAATATPYKTGAIVVYDREAAEVARFSLLNMWPSKVTGSALEAGSDTPMVEELTIQHEFLEWA
jgi:phage tail-like protein